MAVRRAGAASGADVDGTSLVKRSKPRGYEERDQRRRIIGIRELLTAQAVGGREFGCHRGYARELGRRFCPCGISAMVPARGGNRQRAKFIGKLARHGQEPNRVLALANSDNTKATRTAETDAARELGIFGPPTFTVGRELFWGDDRLADRWR
jgi:2-hydroxychromene-2-carboxylate isomerase